MGFNLAFKGLISKTTAKNNYIYCITLPC